MKIVIETIDHKDQRYPTTGDWIVEHGDFFIRVSKMGNWRYEVLVGIHEAIEAVLCREAGIHAWEVDKFDMAFEEQRTSGDNSEPGDDFIAPYYMQHQVATGVERILAAALNVSWKDYEKANEALYKHDE